MNREEVFLLKSNPYGLDEDKISCLEHLASEYLIKWGYIAVIEGMPTQSIINFAKGENHTSTSEFLKIRDEMLKRKFTDVSLIREEVAVTVKSATNAIEESQELRKIFTENMEKMLADGKDVLEEKIKLKESSIDKLKQELSDKERTCKAQEQELVQVKNKLQQLSREKQSTEVIQDRDKQDKRGDTDLKKKYRLPFLINRKSEAELEKEFIEKYIGSDLYTIEQKEFFLECMEVRVPLSEIEKVAIANLPLEMMKRLSKVGSADAN